MIMVRAHLRLRLLHRRLHDWSAAVHPAGIHRVADVPRLLPLVDVHRLIVALLLTRLLDRHPEIREVEIRRPIIIAGLPRTGTTHLHNLLAADTSLRSLPYWESLEPVLAEGEEVREGQPDPRLTRTEAGLAFLDRAAPHFKRMHEMTVDLLEGITERRLADIIDTRWDPPVTVAVRIVSVVEDCLQHLGQANYVAGLCRSGR